MSGLRLLGCVGAVLLATLLAAAPAQAVAQVDVFIEVNPSTIQAGYQVGIHASCGEDLNPASVRSRAFGEITLQPDGGTRLMSGSATVPATTRPGDYPVELRCANGAEATAELFVLDMPRPTRGPDTGGGGTATGAPGGDGAVLPALLALAGLATLGAGAGLLLTGRARPS